MADLQATLHAHHQAVEAFLAAARAVPATHWVKPRLPGKWSPGQVAEHLALAYEVSRGVFDGQYSGASAPRFLRPLIRRFGLRPVLLRGRFIPGSKSPESFRPSDSPDVLLVRLRAAMEAFEAEAASAGAGTVNHPFFGRISVVDFVRLQDIHTVHHRGQLVPASA